MDPVIAEAEQLVTIIDRLENYYGFECPGGPLKNCVEWRQLLDALSSSERGKAILWGRIEEHARLVDEAGIPTHNEHGHAYLLEHRVKLLVEALAASRRSQEERERKS